MAHNTKRTTVANHSPLHRTKGFTLIEVMIAVFVLVVGMLGVARMQALGVQETQNTVSRTVADMLVHDMLDRMRANRNAAQDTAASPYVFDSSTDTLTPAACDSSAASCTPDEMAGFDLSELMASVQAANLPNATVRITRESATNSIYTIQVFWDEDRDGTVATACNGSQACTQIIVQI